MYLGSAERAFGVRGKLLKSYVAIRTKEEATAKQTYFCIHLFEGNDIFLANTADLCLECINIILFDRGYFYVFFFQVYTPQLYSQVIIELRIILKTKIFFFLYERFYISLINI